MLTNDKQERKEHPIATGFIDYFPRAVAAVANLSHVGNEQHNPGEPLHWAREKSNDHPDCLMRHFVQRGTVDDDGVPHSVKVAWRAMAIAEIELEAMKPVRCPGCDILGTWTPDPCRICERRKREREEQAHARERQRQFNLNIKHPIFFGGIPLQYDPTLGLGLDVGMGKDSSVVSTYTAPLSDLTASSEQAQINHATLKKLKEEVILNPIIRLSDIVDKKSFNIGFLGEMIRGATGASEEVARQIAGGVTLCPYPTGSTTYIAGPMRGYEEYNFPAFDAARDHASARGVTVISPADIDRAAGLKEGDDVTSGEACRTFVYRDVMSLLFLRPANGDYITMLEGWEASTGACGEFFIARWLGLPAKNQGGEMITAMDFNSGLFFETLLQWFDDNAR